MKKQKENRCPGCSRHCPAHEIRCKRGRIYFEKLAAQGRAGEKEKKYKWEEYVAPEGVMARLLKLAARSKRALRSGEVTEAQLMSALTGEEQDMLRAVLEKMDRSVKNGKEDDSKKRNCGI